ncbi:MAG: peptide deformylase [Ruminococcus sp.]|nr:peptide deformylase [Ruminococcus sp.]
MTGQRPTQRYPMIVMESLDRHFKKKKQIFRDFEAQVIQHEIDHVSRILIEPTEKSLFRFLQFISAVMW